MAVKNILFGFVLAGALAGCATQVERAGVQPQDLRQSGQLITETLIGGLDFPMLQSNLFQHRAACGSAPRFVMHEGETSYASLIEVEALPESYENVIVIDLIQYPDSIRSPMRVAASAYSYYNNPDVQRRVDNMLAAVRTPGVCAA